MDPKVKKKLWFCAYNAAGAFAAAIIAAFCARYAQSSNAETLIGLIIILAAGVEAVALLAALVIFLDGWLEPRLKDIRDRADKNKTSR